MQRGRFDHLLVLGVLATLAMLMRVPPRGNAPAPAEPPSGPQVASRVRVLVDNGLEVDDSFAFEMRGAGIYETRLHIDGRDFTLHGSVSPAEAERFLREVEAHAGPCPAPCVQAALLRAPSPPAPRYQLEVEGLDGEVHRVCLADAWSPRYQALRRFLDRTLVGRTHEALKKAAGL